MSRGASRVTDHDFQPVAGHPDDDECTHRSDGTDATYCGEPRAWHDVRDAYDYPDWVEDQRLDRALRARPTAHADGRWDTWGGDGVGP